MDGILDFKQRPNNCSEMQEPTSDGCNVDGEMKFSKKQGISWKAPKIGNCEGENQQHKLVLESKIGNLGSTDIVRLSLAGAH